MNKYFDTFENVTQSVEQILKDESNSLEIKQSAIQLKDSVQPCLKELKQAATKLKGLIEVNFNHLNHAEDIWNSKPKIAQASTSEIWEQLGELSGRTFRVHLLKSKSKQQAVEKAKKSWEDRINRLKNTWFIDAKRQLKKGVGFGDKAGFVQDLRLQVSLQSTEVNSIIKHELSLVYQEVILTKSTLIQCYINLLNQQEKDYLLSQNNLLHKEIETKFNNPKAELSNNKKEFGNTLEPILEALINQGWGEIYWEQVLNFKNKVLSIIESVINIVFDDRVDLAAKAFEQAIAFYNDFLERQQRYQQETPEQRKAEHFWIEQQRWQLLQVKNGIEVILSQDNQ